VGGRNFTSLETNIFVSKPAHLAPGSGRALKGKVPTAAIPSAQRSAWSRRFAAVAAFNCSIRLQLKRFGTKFTS